MPKERECLRDMRNSACNGDSRGCGVSFGLSCVCAVRIAYCNRCAYAVMTEVQICEDSRCEGSEIHFGNTEKSVRDKVNRTEKPPKSHRFFGGLLIKTTNCARGRSFC